MPAESHSFKRLVLGLQPSAPDRALQLAVELAELLDLDLLGLFLEDTSLRDLASIPFAREFRPLGGGWHPIDLDRLTRDAELAAGSIERMFTAATKRLARRCQFEIARGPAAATLTSLSRAGDIVIILEPVSAAERATQQFGWLLEAAFRSVAAVMIVPPRIVRTAGPIVAIAAGRDDPSLDAAAAVARAIKEELIVVDVGKSHIEDAQIHLLAEATGVTIRQIVVGANVLSDPTRLSQAIGDLRERLLVIGRGAVDDRAISAIASTRSVPVLVIEPAVVSTDDRAP